MDIPNNRRAELDELKRLSMSGETDEAVSFGLSLLKSSDIQARVYHLLGDTFLRRSMHKTAIHFYRESLGSGGDSAWTHFNLARCLEILDDKACVEHYDAALQKAKTADFLLGKARSKFTDLDKKRELLRYCVQRDPSYIFWDWKLQNHFPQSMKGDLHRILTDGRITSWFKPTSDSYDPRFENFARLCHKDYANMVASELGLRVPKEFFRGKLEDIRVGDLPSRYVLKPTRGESSKGVILAHNGVDIFNRREIGTSFAEYYAATGYNPQGRTFIVEEFVKDYGFKFDPSLIIPRDFKCFAAGGNIYWINVYNRNRAAGKPMTVGCHDLNWKRIKRTTNAYAEAPAIEAPPHLEKLKDAVRSLSKAFPYFMRFDFYMTEDGPVFSEFTHYPSGGLGQTEFGERTQLQLLFINPDPTDPIHDETPLRRAAERLKGQGGVNSGSTASSQTEKTNLGAAVS